MATEISVKTSRLEDEIKRLNDEGYTVQSSKKDPEDDKMTILFLRASQKEIKEPVRKIENQVSKKYPPIWVKFDFGKFITVRR